MDRNFELGFDRRFLRRWFLAVALAAAIAVAGAPSAAAKSKVFRDRGDPSYTPKLMDIRKVQVSQGGKRMRFVLRFRKKVRRFLYAGVWVEVGDKSYYVGKQQKRLGGKPKTTKRTRYKRAGRKIVFSFPLSAVGNPASFAWFVQVLSANSGESVAGSVDYVPNPPRRARWRTGKK